MMAKFGKGNNEAPDAVEVIEPRTTGHDMSIAMQTAGFSYLYRKMENGLKQIGPFSPINCMEYKKKKGYKLFIDLTEEEKKTIIGMPKDKEAKAE
jgi:hypothetical protein